MRRRTGYKDPSLGCPEGLHCWGQGRICEGVWNTFWGQSMTPSLHYALLCPASPSDLTRGCLQSRDREGYEGVLPVIPCTFSFPASVSA